MRETPPKTANGNPTSQHPSPEAKHNEPLTAEEKRVVWEQCEYLLAGPRIHSDGRYEEARWKLRLLEENERLERENAEAWKEARAAGEGVGCLPCEGTSLSGLICGTGDIAVERIEKLEAENAKLTQERDAETARADRLKKQDADHAQEIRDLVPNYMQLWAPLDAVRVLVREHAKLAEQLADEERAHLITIDQREHHEGSINEIALSLGFTEYEREWSNVNDVGRRCVDFIDALTQLAQSIIPGATVEQVLERAKVWREALEAIATRKAPDTTGVHDAYWEAIGIATEALRPAGEENPTCG